MVYIRFHVHVTRNPIKVIAIIFLFDATIPVSLREINVSCGVVNSLYNFLISVLVS